MAKQSFAELLSPELIQCAADQLGCEPEVVEAVLVVESVNGSGFLDNGAVKILYERHVAARSLEKRGNRVTDIVRKHPQMAIDISFSPYAKGGYGKVNAQWGKFQRLAELPINDSEECAIMACSWGAFQVLGENYESLDYKNPQEFRDAMQTPQGQLDAFVRYVKANKLESALKRRDWEAFARGYNGRDYAKFGYHWKMQKEYVRIIGRNAPKKPVAISVTTQTAVGIGTTGAAGLTLLDQVQGGIDQIKGVAEQVAGVKEQATGIISQVSGIQEQTSAIATQMEWIPMAMGGQTVLIMLLAAVVVYRYLKDRGSI